MSSIFILMWGQDIPQPQKVMEPSNCKIRFNEFLKSTDEGPGYLRPDAFRRPSLPIIANRKLWSAHCLSLARRGLAASLAPYRTDRLRTLTQRGRQHVHFPSRFHTSAGSGQKSSASRRTVANWRSPTCALHRRFGESPSIQNVGTA